MSMTVLTTLQHETTCHCLQCHELFLWQLGPCTIMLCSKLLCWLLSCTGASYSRRRANKRHNVLQTVRVSCTCSLLSPPKAKVDYAGLTAASCRVASPMSCKPALGETVGYSEACGVCIGCMLNACHFLMSLFKFLL